MSKYDEEELKDFERLARSLLDKVEGKISFNEEDEDDSQYTIDRWLTNYILEEEKVYDEDGEVEYVRLVRCMGGPHCELRVYPDGKCVAWCCGWFGKNTYEEEGYDKVGLRNYIYY